MSMHGAIVRWARLGEPFVDGCYSRLHAWEFDGGTVVPASSSPAVVPVPLSSPQGVDPEEAFVAALTSCHMLWFLSIAQGRGYVVDRYSDAAEGIMGRDARNQIAMTRIRLRPEVAFSGRAPDRAEFQAMHDEAHHRCFLAASVRTEISCRPIVTATEG